MTGFSGKSVRSSTRHFEGKFEDNLGSISTILKIMPCTMDDMVRGYLVCSVSRQ